MRISTLAILAALLAALPGLLSALLAALPWILRLLTGLLVAATLLTALSWILLLVLGILILLTHFLLTHYKYSMELPRELTFQLLERFRHITSGL